MYSHRDLLMYYTRDILPQNILLLFSKFVISCVLTSPLLAPCGFFDYFLLSESIWRALILPVLVLDSARTMHGPAEHFIHQEQRGN